VDFTLRLAVPDDVPRLEQLIPLSARMLQANDYSPAQLDGAIGTIFGVDSQLIADRTYFVAESGATLIGCGGWSRRKTRFGGDHGKSADDPALDPARDAARIRAFFVHPSFARQGVGRRLLKASEDAAFQAGFRRIEITATLAGVRLYLAFGYEVVRRYEIPLPNGAGLPAVDLARSIAASADR
jgi:GNAT superfamily N-acetyltransferase